MSLDNKTSINNKPLIRLDGISKTYKNAAGSFTALSDINLNFYKGEFIGVIGKSGSGKSTLVNMITGIDRPTKGKVWVESEDIHAMKEGKQARWRGLNMGVVFQFFQLLPMLSLVENVLLPMDFCEKYDPKDRYDRAMELLSMVDLLDVAHKLPGSVSGGQQQSAAIARALANDPPIIVADEPTGNLDANTASSVYDKFKSLAKEGRTIIMITHDPEIEPHLSRKVLISDGEVIDPLLTRALPWLPHPSLRRLTHTITQRKYQGGERVDITGELADQFIIVDEGEIRLSFKAQAVTLSKGNYFAGRELIPDENLRHAQVKAIIDQTTIATLPWEALARELDTITDGKQKIKQAINSQLQGKGADDHKNSGVIQ
jgi:putative ABC transport system ATP-binding protein